MSALIVAVMIASLMGSLHCVGMCGAFVAFAVGAGEERGARSKAWTMSAYHVGRLTTYLVLGAIAGGVGAAIDLGASAIGVQRGAAIGAGVMMIGFGLIVIAKSLGMKLPRAPLPPGVRVVVERGNRVASKQTPMVRAWLIGLFTTLLPCGWLYAFVITAAGTGAVASGMITMVAFWLGTLPALTAVGVGAQAILGPLRHRAPVIVATALVMVGCFTVSNRLMIAPFESEAVAATPVSSQEHDSHAALIERVERLDASEAPCCNGPD